MARKLLDHTLSDHRRRADRRASPASAVTCDELTHALDASTRRQHHHRRPRACAAPTAILHLPSHGRSRSTAIRRRSLDGEHGERILFGSDAARTSPHLRSRRRAFLDGGDAIYVGGNSPITIADSTFTGNDATGPGGAVAIDPFGSWTASSRGGPKARRARDDPRNNFGADLDENTVASGGAVSSYLVPIDVIDSQLHRQRRGPRRRLSAGSPAR